MLSSIGRASVRRIVTGREATNRAILSVFSQPHIEVYQSIHIASRRVQSHLRSNRTYATATAIATKATTKKPTAQKSAPKASSTTTKKAAATKPAKTAAKKPGKTAVKKPTKKLAKKPVKKAVSKAKPKRKGLTELQKEKLQKQKDRAVAKKAKDRERANEKKAKEKVKEKEVKEKLKVKAAAEKPKLQLKIWKEKALEVPPGKPDTAWKLFISQAAADKQLSGGLGKGEGFSMLAEKYKSLSAEEKEHLAQIGAQNSAVNKVAFKQWVETHTPAQIQEANSARRRLRSLTATNKSKKYRNIDDERRPKAARSPYILFCMEKRLGLEGTPQEITSELAREWNLLSAAQREQYADLSERERHRYISEFKTVYGREPIPSRAKKAAAAEA